MSKNILQIIKQQSLILTICLMMITPSFSFCDEENPLTPQQKALNKKIADLEDQAAQLNNPHTPLLPSTIKQAEETNKSCAAFLKKHFVVSCCAFAGMGCGADLSTIYSVTFVPASAWFGVGGLAVGTVGGVLMHKYVITNERCLNNCGLKVGGALLSLVPWLVYGGITGFND